MAHTTIVKDSEVGDAWIQQMMAANPPGFVIDPTTGQPNGNITTGLVRVAFCDSLFVAKPQMRTNPQAQQGEPTLKHSCAFLFPPGVNMSVFQQEWDRIAATDFRECWNGAMWAGIDPPFRQQAEKVQFQGFTPGGYFMNCSSKYKPPIVDARMNPIVDQTKVYAGVWAIAAVNAYASGKGTPKKGPRFGLQTIMIVADDKNLEGGAADPRAMFAGAKVTPPAAPVAAAFGAGAPLAPPPAPSLYGSMPQHPGTHSAPPPMAPQYAAPAYGQAPYPPPPAAAPLHPEITDPNMRAMYGLPPL